MKAITDLPALALSVRQPFAELIVKGVKPVENRTRRTFYRGPVLIHASKFEMSLDDWMDFVDFTFSRGVENCLETHPKDLLKGGIVGIAEIVDCVTTSDSPFFTGPYGWTLANARPLPFKACRGLLGFFKVDYAALP